MVSKTDLKQLRVLVVDDDEFMLDIVNMNLARLGITQVVTFSDGEKVLATLDSGDRFDVAMVDLNMPVMDGIQVLRNLAVREFTGGILLFSGEDARILKTAESLASSHNLHVLGALGKPVTVEILRDKLMGYRPKQAETQRKAAVLVTADDLRAAIDRRHIIPFFQPKVRLSDRTIASAEVLARWLHPQRGMVPPIAFIPTAEEEGLIDDLTQVVFEQAIEQTAAWRKQGYEFNIGLNLSADSLGAVDLPERLANLAIASALPCQTIELEITESRLMQNITTSLDVLTRLRLKGFGLSIDDFGTGYSSMSQLRDVPFTELKIDRAFVHGAADDPAARAILESSAALARKLDMIIVAEGVEDQADWDLVAQVGCDLAQGYFIAKPMPGEQFEAWQKEWIVRAA